MEGTLFLQNFVEKTMKLIFGRSDYKKVCTDILSYVGRGIFVTKQVNVFSLPMYDKRIFFHVYFFHHTLAILIPFLSEVDFTGSISIFTNIILCPDQLSCKLHITLNYSLHFCNEV